MNQSQKNCQIFVRSPREMGGVGKVFGICTNIFKNSFPLGDSLFFFIFNFTEVIDDEKNCILW